MTLIIEPYETVGPLHFGMSQDEVIDVVGEPNRITKSRNGNLELWYNDNEFVVTIENDRFVETGFMPEASVSICCIQPFVDLDAFAKLCGLDANPHEVLGFIVLQNLGITLTGFHDNDESQKALTAFERGRWDVMDSQMKPYHVTPMA